MSQKKFIGAHLKFIRPVTPFSKMDNYSDIFDIATFLNSNTTLSVGRNPIYEVSQVKYILRPAQILNLKAIRPALTEILLLQN